MFNWPARWFPRKEEKGPTDTDRSGPPRFEGDPILLRAAEEALRTVLDPELGINIVDLGLVFRIDARERRVEAEIGLTSPSCPLGDHIAGLACDAIGRAVGDEVPVTVRLDRAHRWTAARMAPAARRQLGLA